MGQIDTMTKISEVISQRDGGAALGLPPLSPAQARVFDKACELLPTVDSLLLTGWAGRGKTTILRHMQAALGGTIITAADVIRVLNSSEPHHLEEALTTFVRQTAEQSDIIYFDNWGDSIMFGAYSADRPHYLSYTLAHDVIAEAAKLGKKFVQTGAHGHHHFVRGANGVWISIEPLEVQDMHAIITWHLGRDVAMSEIETLRCAYAGLSGYQLAAGAKLVRERGPIEVKGADLIAAFDIVANSSNVNLAEVENIEPSSLVGAQEHLQMLERTVILPMTQPEIAREFGYRPARGVLLHGPPGTGKTTIGRILAHRMKGKFYMIDGTFIADDIFFNEMVDAVLKTAASTSPSVVFIDDADVIFRNGEKVSFARKLLSKLDGLAHESQRDVCLVMTAMEVTDMPPALVRSGRAELWLEMKLPDLAQRAEIIRQYAAGLPAEFSDFEAEPVAKICEGFTPADLRGLVGDARAAAAYDRHTREPVRTFGEYLTEAAQEVRARKALIPV